MDGCFRDGSEGSNDVGRLTLLEEFRHGHDFLEWVSAFSGAEGEELRARTAGASLSEVAIPGEHPSRLKRRCGCMKLGLESMGHLLGQVARALDRSPERSPLAESVSAWTIAQRLAPSHRFLDECAQVCTRVGGLATVERDILRARLEAGSVAAAAKLVRCSPSTVANVSTLIFEKLKVRQFSQMPRAIADAIDELNAGAPSRDLGGRE